MLQSRLMLLILKLAVVAFFLIMFVRRASLAWGIGLLTVVVALLLDAFATVFGRTELLESLGAFTWVIGGGLAAGAFLWLVGLLRGQVSSSTAVAVDRFAPRASAEKKEPSNLSIAGFDRPFIYAQMRDNLGPDDLLDVIFDMGLNENAVISPGMNSGQAINRIIDDAIERGDTMLLATSVERCLTPIAPDHLPRLAKISDETPLMVLRQFIIAHYDLAGLQEMARKLGIDWESLGTGPKKTRVRLMMLYLKRRNRMDELVRLVKSADTSAV
ncbi:MAG: hypothetical protein M9941_06430 [Anaerolineae bacterium]|nr:hypothetical protein [Anaerolineae bacterium]MCO5197372.1 hypothetical protein [Anaerolineae bacterium]